MLSCDNPIATDEQGSNNKDGPVSCKYRSWHSIISVADKVSGLRSIKVTSPGSRLIRHTTNEVVDYPLNIGSRENVVVWVETSCCYDGVEITAIDLRRQMIKCVAGINPNKAHSSIWAHMLFNIICIFAIMHARQIWENTTLFHLPQNRF